MPDFIVTELEIKELWGRKTVGIKFKPDVNILVGRNGTGKTTVLNLLNAVLMCDIAVLGEIDFEEVRVRLEHGKQRKTINVRKGAGEESMEYRFGREKGMPVPLWAERGPYRTSPYSTRSARLRMERASEAVRGKLAGIVHVRSISVHRTPEREREREEQSFKYDKERMPAVDARLDDLLGEFIEYQALLGTQLDKVSQKFQEDVSLSMLYDPGLDTFSAEALQLDLKSEEKRLHNAFTELDIDPSTFTKRLHTHIRRLSGSVEALRDFANKEPKGRVNVDDLFVWGLIKRTEHIINLADNARHEKLTITGQRDKFVELCNDFFEDKSVGLDSDGKLFCSLHDHNEAGEDNTRLVPMVEKLSSGEKQLLIMLIETLVQRNEPCVFMTDEPEISLHVAWQEKVLSSIRLLNPNSQLIVATHSPDIISEFGEHTIGMQGVMEASDNANA